MEILLNTLVKCVLIALLVLVVRHVSHMEYVVLVKLPTFY